MIKRIIALLAALAAVAATLALNVEPASATPKKCHGGKSSGVCYTIRSLDDHVLVVQNIPLKNDRKKGGATFHCKFEDTITRSFEAGASLTIGAKADIIGVAEVSQSVNLSLKLTQSASTATGASADVYLKHGEGVWCQRTYGYYTGRVTETHYSASSVWTKQYNVKLPFYLGVRMRDM